MHVPRYIAPSSGMSTNESMMCIYEPALEMYSLSPDFFVNCETYGRVMRFLGQKKTGLAARLDN